MVLMHLVHGETEAWRAQVAAGPALGMMIMNINGDQHVLWGPTRVMEKQQMVESKSTSSPTPVGCD